MTEGLQPALCRHCAEGRHNECSGEHAEYGVFCLCGRDGHDLKLGDSMHVPFTRDVEAEQVDVEAVTTSGLVVLSATMDYLGTFKPCFVFRFATPDGGMLPDIALVVDEAQALSIKGLVIDAVDVALKETRRRNREKPSAEKT